MILYRGYGQPWQEQLAGAWLAIVALSNRTNEQCAA